MLTGTSYKDSVKIGAFAGIRGLPPNSSKYGGYLVASLVVTLKFNCITSRTQGQSREEMQAKLALMALLIVL